MTKWTLLFYLFILMTEMTTAADMDNCTTPKLKRKTPNQCKVSDKMVKWSNFSKKEELEGMALIKGKLDPLDCIPKAEDPLSIVWKRTGMNTWDSIQMYIILFPVVAGIVLLRIARLMEPKIHQDISRDKYGYLVRRTPALPVSYLQESDKDRELKRVKRNTVGWYCHKWFFYTNDIIREISLEPRTSGQSTNPWEKVRFLGKFYTVFRHARQKSLGLDAQEIKKEKNVMHRFQRRKSLLERRFPVADMKWAKKMDILQHRQPQLKKLWLKILAWVKEIPRRDKEKETFQRLKKIRKMKASKLQKQKRDGKFRNPLKKKRKVRPGTVAKMDQDSSSGSSSSWGDSEDSYFGSSESFSSDHVWEEDEYKDEDEDEDEYYVEKTTTTKVKF